MPELQYSIHYFKSKNCPNCKATQGVVTGLRERGYKVNIHDIDGVDGLAQASFFSVQATPTLLIVDEFERETAGFRSMFEIKEVLAAIKEVENANN